MEILKNKTTWLLIIMILGIAFVGGLEQKKTVEPATHNGHYIANDLQK